MGTQYLDQIVPNILRGVTKETTSSAPTSNVGCGEYFDALVSAINDCSLPKRRQTAFFGTVKGITGSDDEDTMAGQINLLITALEKLKKYRPKMKNMFRSISIPAKQAATGETTATNITKIELIGAIFEDNFRITE